MPYVFHNFIPRDWALEIIPEDEFEMILDLERDIVFSERNEGREINMTNYGSFHTNEDAEYTEEELKFTPRPMEPWMDIAPEGVTETH
jgi:hypothetical protein